MLVGTNRPKGDLLVGRSLVPPPPHRGVPGVSKTALWGSWKEVRKKLRDSSLRDIVDWVEYDVDPEKVDPPPSGSGSQRTV